jgi:LacI family transcriptional regulator
MGIANPTLKDIAKETGVSIATVSLVLNGKGNISQDVREKVYDVAQRIGYVKTANGGAAALNDMRHVAILVHEDYERAFLWNFIREMIIQLEAVLAREQYYPVILPVSNEQKTAAILEKILLSKMLGVFSIHYGNAELFQQLESQNIPVVVVNNSGFQNQFHAVCVDDFQGAYEGTLYLLSLGHQHLGYIDYYKPDVQACVDDRFIGFKKAIDEKQINFSKEERITVNLYNMDELARQLEQLFRQKQPPTALFVHDDYLAAQIMVLLHRMKLKIPDDVSILAPGDTLDFNLAFTPQITSMSINTSLIGKFAGEMMLERLEHAELETHVVKITQKLIERGSCRRI